MMIARIPPLAAVLDEGATARMPRLEVASAPPPVASLVRQGRITVAYQPIVDVRDGSVFAYEALARCDHPAYAAPPDLIAAARAQGVLGRLGRYIRRRAVSGCPHATLFLNVDPAEFDEPFLLRPDEPSAVHLPGAYLELTEATPTTHYRFLTSALRELRARGVRLALDDMGAGYSNLRNVADLEPAIVKLDRELIIGLAEGTRAAILVRGLVAVCRELDCEVIAEGVETAEELQALRAVGVHLVQGFLFARPQPRPVVRDWRDILR